MLLIGAATTQGTRSRQEDAFSYLDNRVAVFDGLGGQGSGDKASQAAAAAFAHPEWKEIREAIRMAHWAVIDVQLRADAWGRSAATTIAAVEFSTQGSWSARSGLGRAKQEHHITAAWSGDSRVYLFRPQRAKGSRLEQISRDHHNGDGLTSCLGSRYAWQPEYQIIQAQPEDLVLLTTDGLHGLPVDLESLIQGLLDQPEQEIAQTIIDLIAPQASDNATLVVARSKP